MLTKFNAFHVISVTGIIFSIIAHGILFLIDKNIANFWYLYPTWVLVFAFGYLWNVIDKDDDHHH
jgi:uncharacterized membrane protein YbhN (UPF0104 family)